MVNYTLCATYEHLVTQYIANHFLTFNPLWSKLLLWIPILWSKLILIKSLIFKIQKQALG